MATLGNSTDISLTWTVSGVTPGGGGWHQVACDPFSVSGVGIVVDIIHAHCGAFNGTAGGTRLGVWRWSDKAILMWSNAFTMPASAEWTQGGPAIDNGHTAAPYYLPPDPTGYMFGFFCADDYEFQAAHSGTGVTYLSATDEGNFDTPTQTGAGSIGRIAAYIDYHVVTPHITSLSPTQGGVGDSVTITGYGFTGASGVKFNGVAASFTVNSDTQITTSVPSGATTGPVTVSNSTGASNGVTFTVYAVWAYSGTAWEQSPIDVYDGTTWQQAQAEAYDGTAWQNAI